MKGHAERNIMKRCWDIGIYDPNSDKMYTFEITIHHVPESKPGKVTEIGIDNVEQLGFLQGLADAMKEMGLFPKDASQAELKATKFHLEDMRKLTFERPT